MSKKLHLLFYCIVFISLLTPAHSQAQGYINYSTYSGGSNNDSVVSTIVFNGETYILTNTTSANYPVTNSSHYSGGNDAVVTKLNHDGSVAYATYIGGSGNDDLSMMQLLNGEIYIAGTTTSANFPVTNGSSYGGNTDIVITKLSTTGAIVFAGYYGGSGTETVSYTPMQIANNKIYLAGNTASSNFPIVNGTPFSGGATDAFVFTLNTTDGSTVFSTCIGGNADDAITHLTIDNGNIYIAGTTTSNNLPVTNGSVAFGGAGDVILGKITPAGSISYLSYIGGTGQEFVDQLQVVNGLIYLTGNTSSHNFPVTDGIGFNSTAILAGFINSFDVNGNLIFSKLLQGSGNNRLNIPYQLKVDNGNVYLSVRYYDVTGLHNSVTDIIKLSSAGDILYSTLLPGVSFSVGNSESSLTDMQVINGEVYLSGTTNSPGYPITNGSAFYTSGTGYFTKLNTSGDITFSTFLGQVSVITPMQIVNNKIYIAGSTNISGYPVTNGTGVSGGTDNIVIVLNADGSTNFASYVGGSNNDDILIQGDNTIPGYSSGLQIDNNEIYLIGKTVSVDYPVTNTSVYKGNNDVFLTRLQFCPFDYDVTNDTLSPAIQTTCKQGLGKIITGKSIAIDSTEAPLLNHNGTAQTQFNSEATYQWQTASSIAGPWTNINTSGVTKNFLPTGGNATQYYRRLAFTLTACGIPATDTSDIATVLVDTTIAPVVNAGGTFYTCPGTSITIGGSPTVSGGLPPYTLSWDMGAGSSPNPIVSPAVTTVYTATVVDSLGCKQISQAIVNSYKANAGPDKNNCAGTAVQIGASPLAGVAGITYNWLAVTGLSDPTIAQPFANPSDTTTYELTVTLPVSGGGTCTTKDSAAVIPIAAPLPNFAGPDQVICLGDSVHLGASPEAGFTYTWAPGDYLKSNTSSMATYYAGNTVMPIPNPGIIYVTAKKGNCSFSDATTVAVIEARADIDFCGPRIIGLPDRTPSINETYSWTKSGPGNFTGSTTDPQVAVDASIGGTTTYTLSVTYNGHSCTDQVLVPDCGSGCLTQINTTAKYGCANFGLNGGSVSLTATCGLPVNFTWSPAIGLSDSTGATVQLTDNISRTYTVTATSTIDPTVHCSDSIKVNDPLSVIPIFSAPDTITCASQPVTIGTPPVAGYAYFWQGAGLSNNSISNPTATVTTSTNYTVQVSDTTGCSISDVVKVTVEQIPSDGTPAGFTVCNNAIIKLGSPAVPNITYQWIPPAAPWQNGTDATSAQPQVLVAANQNFFRIMTSAHGCSKFDVFPVTINNSPVIADAPDTAICFGSGVKIGSPALPGVTYLWSPSTGLSDPTIAQPNAAPAYTTIYTVLATFPGSCTGPATDQVTVSVSDPSFTLPAINYCPSGGPVSLGAAAPAGMAIYNWSPSGLVSNYSIPNPTTLNPPPSIATTYTLTVVDNKGCVANGNVTINPGQAAPIPGTSRAICVNSTTSLGSAANATGAGISYQWTPSTYLNDPASIQPLFSATDTGTFVYTVTKTDANISCVSTATITVTVNGFNLPALTSPTICKNTCQQIGTTPIVGAHYLWTPATGLSDPTIANPIACVGTSNISYSLTATGATGCTANATVSVSVSGAAAPAVTVPSVSVCSGASNVTFNPSIAPIGIYNYLWSPDDATLNNIYIATPQIYLTGTGTKQYTLTVTDPLSGCSNTTTASLAITTCSPLAQIGDYVWYDDNQDGLQNINESGAAGVTVSAYNSLGSLVATTVTDATGHYVLKNIQPGNGYYLIFKRLSGYVFTLQNIGGVNAINNSKPDGTGATIGFAVAASDNITNLDAGIIPIATPLPITLVNFAGQLNNNEIALNWQTSAEFNNNYFIIEKSIDGINYTKIGTVSGNGTTTIGHSYSFIDMQPTGGNNYYRLVQVDYDNSTVYSNIVLITAPSIQTMIATYLQDEHSIFISFNKLQKGTIYFNLYTDNGRLVSNSFAENIITNKIATNTLATGIYMLRVISNSNNYSKKIFITQ